MINVIKAVEIMRKYCPETMGNHKDLDIPECGLFCDIEMAGLPDVEIEEARSKLI